MPAKQRLPVAASLGSSSTSWAPGFRPALWPSLAPPTALLSETLGRCISVTADGQALLGIRCVAPRNTPKSMSVGRIGALMGEGTATFGMKHSSGHPGHFCQHFKGTHARTPCCPLRSLFSVNKLTAMLTWLATGLVTSWETWSLSAMGRGPGALKGVLRTTFLSNTC